MSGTNQRLVPVQGLGDPPSSGDGILMSAKTCTPFELVEGYSNTATLGQASIPDALLQDVNC
jgi:hypothetical protein